MLTKLSRTAREKYAEPKILRRDRDADLIAAAIKIKHQIDNLKCQLDDIKNYFLDKFAGETETEKKIATPKGTAVMKTLNSYSIKPDSIPKLQKIFKDSYPVFVTEKLAYSPTAAMKKLLADGDYKHSDVVRDAVVIKTSHSVEFVDLKDDL